MVSELAGEGAMPPQLPTPARRLLKIAKLRDCLRQQIRRGSLLLRRGVTKRKVFRYFNPSVGAFQSVIHHQRFRFFPSIASSSLWNRSARCSSKVLVNRTSWSKSVKRSSVVLANSLSVCAGRSPAIPIQFLSKVLITSLWSRSAESSSAELVVAVSSPQRRPRKKKQPIPDFVSEKSQRRVSDLKNRVGELRSEIKAPTANIEEAIERKKFRGVVAEIDSWSRSMDTNLCSLFSKPEQVLRLVLGSAFTERLYQAISPIPKMIFAKREHEFLKEIRICPGNLGRYAKGAWKASGPTVSTLIPANNEPVVEVVEASIENYEERMHACNGAAKLWMQIPTPKRGDIVRHSHLVFVRGLWFMSPFRFKMWWMTQRIETYGQDIPLETQFMIVEGHDASQFEETDEGSALHVVFLPILENDFRDVPGNWNADNELEMCLDSGNYAVEEFQQSHLVFVVARSNRERKKMPELIDTGNSDNPFDTDGSVQMQNNENVANTSSSTALLTDDLYGIDTVLNTSEQKKMMKFHLLFCFTTHTGASEIHFLKFQVLVEKMVSFESLDVKKIGVVLDVPAVDIPLYDVFDIGLGIEVDLDVLNVGLPVGVEGLDLPTVEVQEIMDTLVYYLHGGKVVFNDIFQIDMLLYYLLCFVSLELMVQTVPDGPPFILS